jgi:hypothetical protein
MPGVFELTANTCVATSTLMARAALHNGSYAGSGRGVRRFLADKTLAKHRVVAFSAGVAGTSLANHCKASSPSRPAPMLRSRSVSPCGMYRSAPAGRSLLQIRLSARWRPKSKRMGNGNKGRGATGARRRRQRLARYSSGRASSSELLYRQPAKSPSW